MSPAIEVQPSQIIERILTLEIVRVTERAAVSAARLRGRGNEKAFIVSAREIDCLKWMAAGKTAWEVSTILGISERTVRFHLNAAREKLQCTTTTQAVAKAVSQQLFVP